ncbi:MAG: FadR family transcriptional regulator [Planctomycetes bacterium]|nr:FadR family transcriptional regulator [Planctomycetota bacterium]
MPFVEIKSVPLVDRVEKQLLQSIHTGQIKSGNLLPSEQEIAGKMNVSRNVVREALSRLRVLGLVESHKKRRTIVTSPKAFDSLKMVLHPVLMDEEQSSELRELRIIIELGLIELLFKNKTDQDVCDLEKISKREKNMNGLSRKEKVDLDVAFHKRLYEATGNKALMQFQSVLVPFFHEMENLHTERYHLELSPEATHAGLVSILKTGTSEQFRNAMREHLKIFIDGIDSSFTNVE